VLWIWGSDLGLMAGCYLCDFKDYKDASNAINCNNAWSIISHVFSICMRCDNWIFHDDCGRFAAEGGFSAYDAHRSYAFVAFAYQVLTHLSRTPYNFGYRHGKPYSLASLEYSYTAISIDEVQQIHALCV
jgi:hypothetical protein